jgi:gluconolactonase
MAWYRIKATLPEKVGDVDVAGSAVWFRTTVDDYAEVWVDGKIDLAFGKSGRGAISGFNTPNEVKLTDNAKPGQTIQIAVLAINSPFGNPPGNFIFFRDPTALRFYKK